MRFLLLCICFGLVSYFATGQTFQFGGPNPDKGQFISTLPNGNVILGGTQNDSCRFADTVLYSYNQNDTITRNGKSSDIMLARLDSGFDLKWIRQFGGLGYSSLQGLEAGQNQLVMAARFYKKFMTGKDTINGRDGFDQSIICLNTDGTTKWVSTFKSPNDVSIETVAQNDQGAVFVLGNVDDSLYLDNNSYTDTSLNSFLVKYQPDGTKSWVKVITDPIYSYDIALGSNNHLYYGGIINEKSLSLDGQQLVPSDTGSRAFIVKLNQGLEKVWAKTGFHDISRMRNMAYDQDDAELYVSGFFNNYLIFEDFSFNTGEIRDGFLFKLNSEGQVEYSQANSIDESGTVDVLKGEPFFSINGEDGVRILSDTLQTNAFLDGWVGKLGANGKVVNQVVTQGQAPPAITRINDIAINKQGDLFTTGSFNFETEFGDTVLSHWGSDDGYIWKIPNFTQTSGLADPTDASKNFPVSLYPNPTSGKLILENEKQQQSQPVTIYNAQGQPVKQGTLYPGTNTWNLDLPSGLYFLRANSQDGVRAVKRIVVK